MTMTLIETAAVSSSGAANIEFTSIGQNFDDLVLKVSVRTTRTGTDVDDELRLEFNGSGGTQYSTRMLEGSGSTVRSVADSSQAYLTRGVAPTDNATANTFSSCEYYISNYTSSNNKSVSFDSTMETNATYSIMTLSAGLWANSAPITSIKITAVGTFDQHSIISLYGIKKGSDGIVTTTP
jgi:hypothetical protein